MACKLRPEEQIKVTAFYEIYRDFAVMGTFLGHIVPGSMFIIYAIWLTVHVLRRHFQCTRTKKQFVSSVWYPCDFCNTCKEYPTEAIIKFVFATTGIVGEIYTAMDGGRFVYYGNGQHVTMFFFFGMTGVLDILYYHKCPLPQGIDYACNWLAFYVEGVLFNFHLIGRSEVDVIVHTCLIYCIVACGVSVITEAVYRKNVLIALCRPYFTFVQGTWFIQIAFILYNPLPNENWNTEDAMSSFLVVILFVVHFAAVFILVITISAVLSWYYKYIYAKQEHETKPLMSPSEEN